MLSKLAAIAIASTPLSQAGNTWKAPADDSVLNAGNGQPEKEMTVRLNVAKMDYFGAQAPHMDVDFVDETDEKHVEIYFPGTSGNTGSKMPHWLSHGSKMKVKGRRETGATETKTLKGQLLGNAQFESETASSDQKEDKRPVFVVREIEEVEAAPSERRLDGFGNETIARSLAGNAPTTLKALVMLVTPCGHSLTKVTEATMQAAFFGDGADSYKSMLGQCSRNSLPLTGKVKSVSICPGSNGLFETSDAVAAAMKNDPDYNAHDYWVHIVPDNWMGSIGVGTVGGGLTWVKEEYFDKATMHLHEIGHNWRLHHAGRGSAEYGDTSSAMGYCCTDRCYNFIHSWQLGFASYKGTALKQLDVENAGKTTEVVVPELGVSKESGVKVETATGLLAISYRGTNGFDKTLGSTWNNQVHVHKWAGTKQSSAEITYLMVQARELETHAIPDTVLKLTFASVASKAATVRLCKMANKEIGNTDALSPCPSVDGSSPAPTPAPTGATPAPTPAPKAETVWTSYIDQTQANTEKSTYAMVGVGCRGKFCAEVKTGHESSIRVKAQSDAWESIPTGVGILQCPMGHVVSQLRCLGTDCAEHAVLCSRVNGGDLQPSSAMETDWFPKTAGAEESKICPDGKLLVGINCGGTKCSQKQLVCQTFQKSAICKPSCNSLGLQCGGDGCGGSCGTCSATKPGQAEEQCYGSSGRCIATGLMSSWVADDKMQVSGMIANGMGCKDSYCGQVRLFFIGVRVASATVHLSDTVSDNIGKKFFWNQQSDAFAADCKEGRAVTRVQCSGKYCDNLKLECANILDWKIDSTGQPKVTKWFSDKEVGTQMCPENYVMVGLECDKSTLIPPFGRGHYCEFKRLRCRHIFPSRFGGTNRGALGAVAANSVSGVKVATADDMKEKNATEATGGGGMVNSAGQIHLCLATILALVAASLM